MIVMINVNSVVNRLFNSLKVFGFVRAIRFYEEIIYL